MDPRITPLLEEVLSNSPNREKLYQILNFTAEMGWITAIKVNMQESQSIYRSDTGVITIGAQLTPNIVSVNLIPELSPKAYSLLHEIGHALSRGNYPLLFLRLRQNRQSGGWISRNPCVWPQVYQTEDQQIWEDLAELIALRIFFGSGMTQYFGGNSYWANLINPYLNGVVPTSF